MINVNEMKPRQRSNSNKVRDDVFTEENSTILDNNNNLAQVIVENGELIIGSQEKQNQENHVVDLIEMSNKKSLEKNSLNSVGNYKRKKINQINKRISKENKDEREFCRVVLVDKI